MNSDVLNPQRVIRVFISSTFKDMHAERDYLVRHIFPELRERCMHRGIQLVDVDLRWGVTEQDAEMGKALEVCLDEIEQCRPFFIGILGERYGWTPDSYQVPDYPQFDWLNSVQKGYSITALEILHGVLKNPEMNPNAFFFFRDPSFIDDIPAEKRSEIEAENSESAQKLQEIKKNISERYDDDAHLMKNYPCAYAGLRFDLSTLEPILNQSGKSDHFTLLKKSISDDHILPKEALSSLPDEVQQTALNYGIVYLHGLDIFGEKVRELLWSAIDEAYPDSELSENPLDVEIRLHSIFSTHKADGFIGREITLSMILHQLSSVNRPVLLFGETGCGKSAIMAELSKKVSEKAIVIQRFCGITKNSSDLISLLRNILTELMFLADYPEENLDSLSSAQLSEKLASMLNHLKNTRNVFLFIDGIEQLSEAHFAHYLQWVPNQLPQNIHVILSTNHAFCKEKAVERNFEIIQIPPLSEKEKNRLVSDYLWKFRKKLGFDSTANTDQMERLLSKKESNLPFYLKLSSEELRIFPRFEDVTIRIQQFPETTQELITQILERLEYDHGKELVGKALSLIAISLHGLHENEILSLLKRKDEPVLPQRIWAGIRRSLTGLLNNPFLEENGLCIIHQKIVRDAILHRYMPLPEQQKMIYDALAKFGESCIYESDFPLINTSRYTAIYLLRADSTDEIKSLFRYLNNCNDSAFQRISIVFSELLDYIMREDVFIQNHPLINAFNDFAWLTRKEFITIMIQKADFYQHNASGLWAEWMYEKLLAQLKLLSSSKKKDAVWMAEKRAAVLNNLHVFYSRNKQNHKAKKVLESAIKIREKLLSKDTDFKDEITGALMGNYLNMSILLMKDEMYEEAKPYLERSNSYFWGKLQKDETGIFDWNALLKIRSSLILVYEHTKNPIDIKQFFKETETALQRNSDSYFNDLGILEGYGALLNNFAGFLERIHSNDAVSTLKKAIEVSEKLLRIRPDNERYIEKSNTLKTNLGFIYMRNEVFEKAEPLLYQVFEQVKKRFWRNHESTRVLVSYTTINRNLLTFHIQQEQREKAAPFMFRAYHLAKNLYQKEPEHWEYKSWMTELTEHLIFYFDDPKRQGKSYDRVVEMSRLHTQLTLDPFWLFSYIDLISDENSSYSEDDFSLANQVLEAHKNSFTANFTLASMYMNEEQVKHAFVYMQAATTLEPDENLHPKLKEIIEQELPRQLRDILFSQINNTMTEEEEDDDDDNESEIDDFDDENEDMEEEAFESEYYYIYEQALKHWDDENYEVSLQLLEEYIQHEPADTEALSLIAYLYHYFERDDEAINTIMLSVSIKPNAAMEWKLLGDIRMQQGESQKALKAYKKAFDCDPSDSDFKRSFMIASFETGDFEKACDLANELLIDDNQDEDAILYKGLSCYELGRTGETIEMLHPLYKEQKCAPLALFCLADSFIDAENYQMAVDIFREIPVDDANYTSAMNNMAYSLKKLGKYEETIEAADFAIKLNPENANPYLHKGQALMELGHLSEAKKQLIQSKKLGNPNADEVLEELKSKKTKGGWFGSWG